MTAGSATALTLSGFVIGFIFGIWAHEVAPPQDLEQRRAEFIRVCEGPEWNGYAITSSGRFLCVKDGRSVDVFPKGVEP